jgi:Ser/Thr protein kinase RdoA (MazF antagonist)
MHANIDPRNIHQILTSAGIRGFSGHIEALGGGEVNDTFKLDCGGEQIILRVSKDEGQYTLKEEARALRLLDNKHVPKLIYFDENSRIDNRLWILESYLPGVAVKRLSTAQFNKLGTLLAEVHKHQSTETKIELRTQFLFNCKAFGDEQFLLDHPDATLRQLIQSAFDEFRELQPAYGKIIPALIHSDATPSNILVDGDEVGLIDWEFSKFLDPMYDFSTIYYEDIEYNRGKWRIKITDEEKRSLFDGYKSAGGKIDEERIRFWIRFDKLGAAVFLHWRINQSGRTTSRAEIEQYSLDYDNVVGSLT